MSFLWLWILTTVTFWLNFTLFFFFLENESNLVEFEDSEIDIEDFGVSQLGYLYIFSTILTGPSSCDSLKIISFLWIKYNIFI